MRVFVLIFVSRPVFFFDLAHQNKQNWLQLCCPFVIAPLTTTTPTVNTTRKALNASDATGNALMAPH